VLAPFYDAACAALARLIQDLAPAQLHLYVPHDISVDGTKLADALAATESDVCIWGFTEPEFVHAKLFGCISGNEGILLSGSANCSRPALMTTANCGNAEVGIVARTTPDVVRDAFLPEGWSLIALDRSALQQITMRRQSVGSGSWPSRLQSARLEGNGHVTVRFEAPGAGDINAVVIDGQTHRLVANRTRDRLDPSLLPSFAWLVDPQGIQISNSVPVDHVDRLATWLQDRSQSSDRPSELYASDVETEIGEMLDELNRKFIFDIDEVLDGAGRRTTGAEAEQGSEDAASKFWDEFDPETLRFDPRTHRYARLMGDHGGINWGSEADIVELLESMIGRFRGDEQPLHGHTGPRLHEKDHPPANPNLQRRVGNLLLRWSKALNDRRFEWFNPSAPVINYHLLLNAVARSRAKGFVTPPRASAITLALLQSFLGSEKRPGYLLKVQEEEERMRLLSQVAPEDPQIAAALVYVALDPSSKWREVVFEWQPFIRSAIGTGLLSAGDDAIKLLDEFSEADGAHLKHLSLARIDDHLEELAVFLNDSQWCKLQREELGFDNVTIRMNSGSRAKAWPYAVTVAGVTTLRIDPRIVALVSRTLTYKRATGVIVEAAEPMEGSTIPQRLSVSLEETPSVFASDRAGEYLFEDPLTKARLRALEEREQGFVEILVLDS
jgi:hypothetical protein